ncbi:hypothetical protein [Bradyrhizobium sp. S3.12.5]|uniref:hypothetical protein n=1 Tax=Bradyrhizobium sp. S3.12.5 TaxID=3156386 RepID=UPI00339A18FD
MFKQGSHWFSRLLIPTEQHAHEVIGFRGYLERAEHAALLARFGKLVPIQC